MSEDEKDGPKRKRPMLYKKNGKNGKDEDILKKLKEVRQNLQDSLDESPEKKAPVMTRKRGERRLYKKDEVEKPTAPIKAKKKPAVEKKPVQKVSDKRMARVQKRVKEKMKEMKRRRKRAQRRSLDNI